MEGLHPSYIAELGQHLKVDPRIWLRHLRVAVWEKTIPQAGNSPRLPSVLAEEGSLLFRLLSTNAPECEVSGFHFEVRRERATHSLFKTGHRQWSPI